MGTVSERLLALRPVTFRYKKATKEGEQPLQFGLIAEEVAEVFPELVVFDDEGQPETVKYHLLTSMLLNELQKQKAVNRQQQELIEYLRTENQVLKNLLKKVEQPHLLTSNFSQNELLEALDASHKVIVALLREFKDSVAIDKESLDSVRKPLPEEIPA